jgi:hypothetical protein
LSVTLPHTEKPRFGGAFYLARQSDCNEQGIVGNHFYLVEDGRRLKPLYTRDTGANFETSPVARQKSDRAGITDALLLNLPALAAPHQ